MFEVTVRGTRRLRAMCRGDVCGIAVFRIGFDRWVTGPDDGPELGDVMDELFGSLRAVTAAAGTPPWTTVRSLDDTAQPIL